MTAADAAIAAIAAALDAEHDRRDGMGEGWCCATSEGQLCCANLSNAGALAYDGAAEAIVRFVLSHRDARAVLDAVTS